MLVAKRIPFLIFIYTYTFSRILLSHQTEEDVKRLIKINNFVVKSKSPLNIEKCPEGSYIQYFQSFGICKKHVNFLTEDTKVWMMPEHVKPESGSETSETLKASKNPLLRAYYDYCQTAFEKSKKCVLNINKDEAGGDRFKADYGLDCQGKGQSLFNGTFFCIETNGSPVQDGEIVSLVGFKDFDIEPRCPEDRKIHTVTAFEVSVPLVNKGLINSFYNEASKKCDGKEQCTLSVQDEGKFKKYRVFTYKCVQQ